MEATHSLSFTRPKPYGLVWRNQFFRWDAKDTQKSFFEAKWYIFFNDFSCWRVNGGCRCTDTAHYRVSEQTVKIGGKHKIVHNKYC